MSRMNIFKPIEYLRRETLAQLANRHTFHVMLSDKLGITNPKPFRTGVRGGGKKGYSIADYVKLCLLDQVALQTGFSAIMSAHIVAQTKSLPLDNVIKALHTNRSSKAFVLLTVADRELFELSVKDDDGVYHTAPTFRVHDSKTAKPKVEQVSAASKGNHKSLLTVDLSMIIREALDNQETVLANVNASIDAEMNEIVADCLS
jgi:hypothetical protein